jgi:hypothetical protein
MFHVETGRTFAEGADEAVSADAGATAVAGAVDAAAAAAAGAAAVEAVDGGLVAELSRYLAAPLDPIDGQGRGRRPAPRLSRVA